MGSLRAEAFPPWIAFKLFSGDCFALLQYVRTKYRTFEPRKILLAPEEDQTCIPSTAPQSGSERGFFPFGDDDALCTVPWRLGRFS